MQLSIIILNYNVRYFLEQCVLSVQKAITNLDAEIIIADNHSVDDSVLRIKTLFPEITVIENNSNLGFPKGNNIAVQKAKGKYVCILNPDTIVAEDTFLKILAFAEKKENVGIIGCKLQDGTGNFLPESKRGIPTPWVAFTKISGLYKWFPNISVFSRYYASHLQPNQTGKVDVLVGAFMVLEKQLYEQVGGFDENCFMYSDDIDLSYMLLLLKKDNYYFHETNVIHYKGESTVRDKLYLKRFSEAMQFFYKKHFNKSLFFDVFMQIGSFSFSLFKLNQQKNKKTEIHEYVIFSKNNLHILTDKNVRYLTSLDDFVNLKTQNIEVVFNISDCSFLEIIRFMEKHKSKNITYKNYIPTGNYLIGSNHANNQGEIIQL